MNHEQVQDRLADLAAGETGPLLTWRLRRHLASCPTCAAEWEQVQSLWRDLGAMATVQPEIQPVWPVAADSDTAQPTDRSDAETQHEERIPMRRRLLLPTLAAGAVLITAALPLTGWLVRMQFKVGFGGGIAMMDKPLLAQDENAPYKAAVERAPNDFLLNLGYALRQPDQRAALKSLAARFPNEPSVWGIYLNTNTNDEIVVSLEKPVKPSPIGTGEPWSPTQPDVPEANVPPILRELITAARAGEAADPQNAYFPMMEAEFLIRAKRPIAAMDAVLRAGKKQRFDTYWTPEIEARWHLNTTVNGEAGSMARTAQMASTMFYWGSAIRNVARAASGRAIAYEMGEIAPVAANSEYAEQAARLHRENVAKAIELRAALLNVAILMQSGPNSYITNLVGNAVGAIAQNQPGGGPKFKTENFGTPSMTNEARTRLMTEARRNAFAAYAKKQNRADLVRLAEVNDIALEKGRRVWNIAQEKSGFLTVPGLIYSGVWLGSGLLLLFNALWTIFFGGLAYVFSRTNQIRRGETLHTAIGIGFGLTFVPALFGIGATTANPDAQILLPLGAVGLIVASFLRLRKSASDESLWRRLGLTFLTMLATLGTIVLAVVLLMGPLAFLQQTLRLYGLKEALDPSEGPSAIILSASIAALLCLAIPLLTIFVLAIRSVKKELPASVGIVRGFRNLAVPMASILFLLYAASAIIAGWKDAQLRRELAEMVQNEAKYMARLAGEEWPFVGK